MVLLQDHFKTSSCSIVKTLKASLLTGSGWLTFGHLGMLKECDQNTKIFLIKNAFATHKNSFGGLPDGWIFVTFEFPLV